MTHSTIDRDGGSAGCLMCGWQSGPIPAATVPAAIRGHICPLPKPIAPPVIVTLPAGVGEGTEVLVRHESYGVEVDLREQTGHSWLPIALAGGSFTVRDR